MKIFTRVMLIIAGIFAIAGIGMTAGGVAMGASLEGLDIVRSIRNYDEDSENVSFWEKLFPYTDGEHWGADWDEELLDTPSSEEKGNRLYQIDPVKKVDIDLKYDELILRAYEEDTIRIEIKNDASNNVRVRSDSDSLEIKSLRKKNGRTVTVSYPRNLALKEMDIEVSAGSVELEDDLKADELGILIGAGEFTASGTLTAKEASIEVGAGSVDITTLDAKTIEGECGMGSISMKLTGQKTDYKYTLECGIGDIVIGGDEFSGIAAAREVDTPGASRSVALECGMGNIEIRFEN